MRAKRVFQVLQVLPGIRHLLRSAIGDNRAATDRNQWGDLPDDKSIAWQQQCGILQFQIQKHLFARFNLSFVARRFDVLSHRIFGFRSWVKPQLGHRLHRVRMKVHPRPLP